jgi:CRP/FNR family transcriptional regulator, cyclic AMP receptor protein
MLGTKNVMEKSNLKPGHLRRIKSLALLKDAQLVAFLPYVEVVNCAKSATLFKEGQAADSMFWILEGQMRVFTEKRNTSGLLFLRMLEAGDSFGEVAQLNQTVRTASIEATQCSVLIKVTTAAFHRLLSEHPALAAQLLFHMARTVGRQLSDLTAKFRAWREQGDVLTS